MTLARHPHLGPSPRGPKNGPQRVPLAASEAVRLWESGAALPAVGSVRRTASGVDVVEVTFLAEIPPGTQWIAHLANVTDRHRESLTPSKLDPIPGSALAGATFVLPADAIVSYRITDVTGLDDGVGRDRAGWRQVHQSGGPDPRNLHRMPTPLGGDASVWWGPAAPWPTWPSHEVDGWVETRDAGLRVRVLPGDEHVVVGFDGEYWEGLCLGAAVRSAGLPHSLVLIDSGSTEQRATTLTAPQHVADHVHLALKAAGTVLRRDIAYADVVIGQSFGGLAVAWLLATYPELACAGIVQSGSFWHQREPADEEIGDLLFLLRLGAGDVSRPVVIQVGSEEDFLVPLSRKYRDTLVERGAVDVGYREVRGGHDYAWWRAGVVAALAELSALPCAAARPPRSRGQGLTVSPGTLG